MLAGALADYEPRDPQVEMATLIAKTIETSSRAVIEAATGTGKTLAYLIPAILSRKHTLISTATKNLQEQIYYKDVPFLQKLGLDFTSAYLKGRNNYLCLYRYSEFQQRPLFRSKTDARYFETIQKWAKQTEIGDRAEITDLPDDYPTWFELSATAETCLGTECPDYAECFVTLVRKEAAKAQILIVNHHLFFADLAVRAGGFGEVMPQAEVVIFDEAHHLEETATTFFGRSVSPFRLRELIGDLRRACDDLKKQPTDLLSTADSADSACADLFATLGKLIHKRERTELERELIEAPSLVAALNDATALLGKLERAIRATAGLGEVAATLARRCREISSDLTFILEQPESGWVYFTECRGRRSDVVFLQACPIDVGHVFGELLYPNQPVTVFTSATLTVDSSFDYFRSRIALGDADPVEEQLLETAFDFMDQALLYVPEDLPEPSSPTFGETVVPVIESLLEITDGRALVLFTSYRNMRTCRQLIREDHSFPILMQGEGSRSALLDRFRAEPSVLLATASFWEGVDVPGSHLSLVVIDKLPFASPFDPVVKARIEYLKEQGGEPFYQYQLPEAAITLKQGFGRLIRHRNDRGIVAILDRRLLERSYGRVFLNTLPRTRRTRDLDIVRRWWEREAQ